MYDLYLVSSQMRKWMAISVSCFMIMCTYFVERCILAWQTKNLKDFSNFCHKNESPFFYEANANNMVQNETLLIFMKTRPYAMANFHILFFLDF
jgi:hypothetical protein